MNGYKVHVKKRVYRLSYYTYILLVSLYRFRPNVGRKTATPSFKSNVDNGFAHVSGTFPSTGVHHVVHHVVFLVTTIFFSPTSDLMFVSFTIVQLVPFRMDTV